jgi:hypothetical protein
MRRAFYRPSIKRHVDRLAAPAYALNFHHEGGAKWRA